MPAKDQECRAEGCAKPADGGKGYCRRHYASWRRGGLAKGPYKTCRVEACRKRILARGRCEEHFARDFPGKRTAAAAATAAPTPEAPAE